METIVIDDLPLENGNPGGDIIDLDEENSEDDVEILGVRQQTIEEQFSEIYKENKALADLIEKCIELDDTGAMKRVMKRTLIPLYQETTNIFKKSVQFERALTKVLTKVDTDPTHKFSHIKEFCEFLKDNKEKLLFTKKKVDFVTLPSDVKANSKKKRSNTFKRRIKKRKVDIVIDLVNEKFEVPIVNLDEEVCYLPSYILDEVPETNHDNEKENESVNVVVNDNARDKILEKQSLQAHNSASSIHINNNVHLEPRTHYLPEHDSRTDEEEIYSKIKSIEAKIKSFKRLAEEMDSKEVTVDSLSSPYLKSEYYHKKIVHLYKQLCDLTGHEPVKRREVRLKAMDSRSELPLKKLQALVNNNIKEDGLPHFPDFEEVVQCIWEANSEGNLNWCDKRVMYEARTLFTYVGRALQRSRQRREWRDMLNIVKNEVLDPADKDPELAAKLERNRIISREREFDVIDRFAALEQLSPHEPTIINDDIQMEQSEDSGGEITEEPQLEITHRKDVAEKPQLEITHRKDMTEMPQLEITHGKDITGKTQLKITHVYSHSTLHPNELISSVNVDNASLPNSCQQINNICRPPNTPTTSHAGTRDGLFLSINTNTETIQFNVIRKTIDCSHKDLTSNCLPETNVSQDVVKAGDVKVIIENDITMQGSEKDSISSVGITDELITQSSSNGSRNMHSDSSMNEVNIDTDTQNFLADNNRGSSRIEVLSIEIENNPDEDLNIKVEKDVNEIPNEPVIERRDEINIPQTECNKSTDTKQIESANVEVKIERTMEDLLRELNEMDDNSLKATIVDIIDPYLVIEISSDSDSDEEEDSNKVCDNSEVFIRNSVTQGQRLKT